VSWLDDVIAVHGEPEMRWDQPLDDRGWLWFPGNVNHCISIKLRGRPAYWVAAITTHDGDKPTVEWRSRNEPTDDVMSLLLQASGFLDAPVLAVKEA
jgi:hypothetical protein